MRRSRTRPPGIRASTIPDDAAGVYDGVQSGSWIEGGISAIGAGMDLLTMAMNPIGTLISYGLNWLIEHVKPLKDALDHLAGDADQIAAYSQTWKNVAQAVQGAGKDLAATVEKDTANWTGPAADTYRANLKNKINHINAASTCAETTRRVPVTRTAASRLRGRSGRRWTNEIPHPPAASLCTRSRPSPPNGALASSARPHTPNRSVTGRCWPCLASTACTDDFTPEHGATSFAR
ncbi:WXG100 family type VII secretion target [Amycolatopsis taiwanensis]|uniref:WXG100 family type VII secretion target n=1 Tax=Amycolatopsis taiwanensis TaxID=342230 RepID=A0A9W6VKC5_9PSEU|nr:hypothetical protein [Amycolatopsis taiwanensis]GLY70464.1 hypothetical protein Atai01_70830 [Amycolatopsis taiwanensis]